jgi:tRNA U34 5-methylaminomethyl-2-thiouridine-forming methyltransferase MnmC
MKVEQFIPQVTGDGSCTFFSEEFKEAFHSHYGAKQEAEAKFVEPAQLRQKASQLPPANTPLRILDVCYGLGYNSAAALAAIWSVNPQCQVKLIALELSATVPRQAIAHQLLDQWQQPIPQLLKELATIYKIHGERFEGQLLIADARKTIKSLCQSSWQADAIFLDPFSPPKCPQLWTVEFLGLVAQCLKPTGRLATYSCSAAVRKALALAGLKFASTPSVGRRSPGTVASFCEQDLPPLTLQEQEHLETHAAIPYRDPYLQDSAEAICLRRQQEQQISTLEPTSHWKKRWFASANQPTKSVNLFK